MRSPDIARWGPSLVGLVAVLAFQVSAIASVARAQAVTIEGAAEFRGGRLAVECEPTGGGLGECRLAAELRFVARAELWVELGRPTRDDHPAARIRGETTPSGHPVRIPAGRAFIVDVRGRHPLRPGPGGVPPTWVRHAVVGDADFFHPSPPECSSFELVRCEDCIAEGVTRLTTEGRQRVSVDGIDVTNRDELIEGRVPHQVAIRFMGDESFFQVVRRGGPLVTLGAALSARDPENFVLRLGYDVLVLAEYLFLQVEVASDFVSFVEESVLLEVSLPVAPGFLPISVAFGIGASFRQLGARDLDAALRGQVIGQLFPLVALVGGFQYWPASDDVSGLLGARVSL